MPIDDEVRRFLLAHVVSVPQLEALLLLRATRDEHWTAERLAARLYLPSEAVVPLLDGLVEAGLVAATEERLHWHYAPRDVALDTLCGAIGDTYAKHLVDISRLIHSKGERAAQRFADAFKLRKD